MDKPARKPYRKHNSFVELRHKHAEAGQAARARFDEVVGTRTSEDVLRHIFERFCIGK